MLYKQVVGNRQTIPKAWTLKNGSQTGNFDLLPESVHNDEGWYQCLDDPTVETQETHKLGVDTLVAKRWVRAVVIKTAQDLADDAVKVAAQSVIDNFVTQLSTGIEGILSAQFKGVTREQADQYIDGKITDPGTATVFKKIAYNLIEINAVIEALEGLGRI